MMISSSYEAHHLSVFFNFVLGLGKTGVAQIESYRNKGKCKVIPLQARCGPEGEWRYSSTLP